MDTDLWFNSFGFLSLQNYIASCNFPSWHRAQVFCRWRDSCGFIRSAFPSTLAFVTHKGPLFKNDKCPHAHLLSKKTLAYGIKIGNMFNHYWVWERGWVSVLTQSRYWLCKRVVFGSHIYRKGTMVVTQYFLSQENATPTLKLPTSTQRRKALHINRRAVSEDNSRNNKKSVQMMRNIEMKYTVPFIYPQDHLQTKLCHRSVN